MSLLAVLDLIVNLIELWRAVRSGREGLQRWWRKRTRQQTEEPIERLIGEIEGVRTQLSELKTRLSHPSFASDSQFMPTNLPRISLINRQREIDVIHRALRDGPELKIIYFLGPGGVGKTRLLEQVSYIVGNSAEGRTTLWGGLIDLYHSETHAPIGLMDSLSKGLDLDSRAFSRYRTARARLESRAAAAIPGHVLEDKRRQATRAFVEDFNEVSASRRVVFALDTAEALQRESEPVATLVEAEEPTTATLAWLLNELGNLKNCVVLVAGRPPGFVDDFLSKYGSVSGQFECMELSGLTWRETQAYFDRLANESPALKGLPLDLRWRIWRMSGGRPLRMALALEVYQYGDLSALFGLSANQQLDIDKQLLNGLLAREEATRLIFVLLAVARKGVNTELLHFIAPRWSEAECRARLALMQNRSLVKARAGLGDLFLHDEVYELFDIHILPEVNLSPWLVRLTAYYRTLLEKTKDRAERADWLVALLYYELHFDPQRAYEELYLPSSEVALKGHELDLDLRLRDEVLRFTSRPANPASGLRQGLSRVEVDRDSAARWVRRHIARGQYDRARRVAERLLKLADLPFDTADPRFRGEVLVYYGEALLYLGASEALVVTALGQAVELLGPTTHSVSETRQSWWQSRLLGTAHNSLGYYHRSVQHYRRAIHEFGQAIAFFRRTDIRDELADSLNNLAFVYGLLGELAPAKALMAETLALRREQNQQYRLALSLNTYGLITLMNGDLGTAERHCTEALTIFEKLGDSRGIGLACIALGQIRRQMAGGTQSAEVDKAFSLGEGLLERAVGIFTTAVKEPIREAETRLEMGCLHREWGLALKSAGDVNIAQPHFEAARRALERVVEMAGPWPVTRVEACLQIARLWQGQGAPIEALGWLEKAEQFIPAEYRPSAVSHANDISEPIEGFWLMLGEISLTRGQIMLGENDVEGDDRQIGLVVEHFVQGFDFIIKFSPSAPALKRYQKDLIHGLSRQSIHILTGAKLLTASSMQNFPQAASILMAIIDEALARSVNADNRRRNHE